MSASSKLHIFRDEGGDWQLEWRNPETGDIGEYIICATHAEAVATIPEFVRATVDGYAEVQWNGLPGAVIESETNPWIKGPDGIAIKFLPGFHNGLCGEGIHWGPGVLAPMDTDEGIQRCDACDLFPGDLEAAAAVARIYGPGFTVWFHGTNGAPA